MAAGTAVSDAAAAAEAKAEAPAGSSLIMQLAARLAMASAWVAALCAACSRSEAIWNLAEFLAVVAAIAEWFTYLRWGDRCGLGVYCPAAARFSSRRRRLPRPEG